MMRAAIGAGPDLGLGLEAGMGGLSFGWLRRRAAVASVSVLAVAGVVAGGTATAPAAAGTGLAAAGSASAQAAGTASAQAAGTASAAAAVTCPGSGGARSIAGPAGSWARNVP